MGVGGWGSGAAAWIRGVVGVVCVLKMCAPAQLLVVGGLAVMVLLHLEQVAGFHKQHMRAAAVAVHKTAV